MSASFNELSGDEQKRRLAELISFERLQQRLAIDNPAYINVLISERRLPAWLVDGNWMFQPEEIERWLDEMGGLDGVKRHLQDWESRKRNAQQKPFTQAMGVNHDSTD